MLRNICMATTTMNSNVKRGGLYVAHGFPQHFVFAGETRVVIKVNNMLIFIELIYILSLK